MCPESRRAGPGGWAVWNTLGVAQYRAGNWQASIDALRKAMGLRREGNGFDWFFLAMAHRRLGNKGEARGWYGRAVGWMDKNRPKDEGLRRFRGEATALPLGNPRPARGPDRSREISCAVCTPASHESVAFTVG